MLIVRHPEARGFGCFSGDVRKRTEVRLRGLEACLLSSIDALNESFQVKTDRRFLLSIIYKSVSLAEIVVRSVSAARRLQPRSLFV